MVKVGLILLAISATIILGAMLYWWVKSVVERTSPSFYF